MSASALYEGTVRHRRVAPVDHEFAYPQRLLYLDLAEVDGLMARARLWSARRPAPGWFRRADFHGDPATGLADAARATVEAHTGRRPTGAVRLLTWPRTLGVCFNPLSLYFCFDGAERVQAIVAEVTNTPWNERHAYVLTGEDSAGGRVMRDRRAKAFHVSPLMGMDHDYDIRVTTPGDTLAVHIESTRAGRRHFDATLNLRRAPLTPRTLDLSLLRAPGVAAATLVRIYAQALRLRLKGAPYHPHPETANR